jgi:prepilin-type N-terminal cleavage/methylation domain-containing protein
MFNNIKKTNTNRAGFTLVEVITALFIVMVGIMSAYGLVEQSLATAKTASMQLTAAYLGKEGIEIVKNIRDSNYLAAYAGDSVGWSDGLTNCGSGCKADYTSAYSNSLSSTSSDQLLKFSDVHLFNYSLGDDTAYKRIITIDSTLANILGVSVLVQWSERGRNHSITVQENLYNWWPN